MGKALCPARVVFDRLKERPKEKNRPITILMMRPIIFKTRSAGYAAFASVDGIGRQPSTPANDLSTSTCIVRPAEAWRS
ncbi:hypothetical protein NKH24_20140 [Mesorhizobium sp. M1300]|uniref:hypothetical protein n=1 Tax=Mesorhizobium sp. M1300 TaxID=2957077 RepID=UPI003337C7B4